MIVPTSIHGNVYAPGGEKDAQTLEDLKAIDENTLIIVRKGESVLAMPLRSLDLDHVTVGYDNDQS